MNRQTIIVLCVVALSACRARVPLVTSSYTPYEHQMTKDWEEAGKKFQAAEYQQALEAYQAFQDKYPYHRWTHMARYFMGQCYERLNQYDKARMVYREVMDKYPGSVWSDLARDRMLQLP